MTTLLLSLLIGCEAPRLYTAEDTGAYVWEAPENSWGIGEVPEDLQPTGTEIGMVPEDFRMQDQHGDEVSLWQFYGQVIVLDISTMWCAPCQDLAATVQETWEHHKDDGFMYITLLPENLETEPPTLEDLEYWSEYFAIEAPVLSDDSLWFRNFVPDDNFPWVVVIDREMKIYDNQLDPVNDATILSAVEELL